MVKNASFTPKSLIFKDYEAVKHDSLKKVLYNNNINIENNTHGNNEHIYIKKILVFFSFTASNFLKIKELRVKDASFTILHHPSPFPPFQPLSTPGTPKTYHKKSLWILGCYRNEAPLTPTLKFVKTLSSNSFLTCKK
jgi:hypothetical protein